MARTYSILVHFEREDGSLSFSVSSGSILTSVVAADQTEAEELAEATVVELGGDDFDFV